MFDSRKIDDFFDGSKPFENDKVDDKAEKSKWLRFVKLAFPCFAAALLGVMLIMPSIKKSVNLQNNITVPRKNEMEQLHMEQTVYSATDADNRINTVRADSVDELSPGSKIIKMANPSGTVPNDKGIWHINADTGYFNQEKNILTLEKNVKAQDDEGTVLTTSKAAYDFGREFGSGQEKIFAEGDWGKVVSAGFEYDKKKSILVLLGEHTITTNSGSLSATEKTTVYQSESKSVSVQNVVISKGGDTIQADKVINYFTKGGKRELKRTEAFGNVQIISAGGKAFADKGVYNPQNAKAELSGNVRIISPKGTAVSDKAVYDLKTAKTELFGNVHIETPKGNASGDKGVYNPLTAEIELEGNVRLEQNGNVIYGFRAVTDLNTSVSRVLPDKTGDGRVSGIFYNKRKK